ncbi:MAG: energy-coupling factor transporter ATPase [Bacilli bacterium]
MSQIEIKNVSYIYNLKDKNRVKALDNVSFNIEKGEFLAIVGKTGSGKSTLVQTFNGLVFPTTGEIKIDDFIVCSDKKKRSKKLFLLRKKVGIVFQFPEYQLFEDNVLKDVMFGPKNFGATEEDARELAKKALNDVGISSDYYSKSPFELSGGEKRRIAIAGILASNPEILVLDEPTAGLDPSGKEEIMNLVKNLHGTGKTIILVTHDMDVVMKYANKVAVLNDSKVIKITTPEKLFNEKDVEKYSLEIPIFYKFKKLLKEKGFAGDLEKINDFSELMSIILKEVKNG